MPYKSISWVSGSGTDALGKEEGGYLQQHVVAPTAACAIGAAQELQVPAGWVQDAAAADAQPVSSQKHFSCSSHSLLACCWSHITDSQSWQLAEMHTVAHHPDIAHVTQGHSGSHARR